VYASICSLLMGGRDVGIGFQPLFERPTYQSGSAERRDPRGRIPAAARRRGRIEA
jgi:hypothetical protein